MRGEKGLKSRPEAVARAASSARWRARSAGECESFFAAQDRHRRATWRLTALTLLALTLMGLPLAAVVSPILLGLAALAADVANVFRPLPDLFHLGFVFVDRIINAPSLAALPTERLVLAAVLLLLPGALLLLALGRGLDRVYRKRGFAPGLELPALRPARSDDPEERQLENVVAEMAIAAAVEPPALAVFDLEEPTAGLVAGDQGAPLLIVSRGLLATLSREETEAVIGHLVGSYGNGDLKIARRTFALLAALSSVPVVLRAPLGKHGRALLGELVARLFHPRGGKGATAEGGAVALIDSLPWSGLGEEDQDADADLDRLSTGGWLSTLRTLLVLPFLTAWMAYALSELLLINLLLGPAIALLWRNRRYLADATAVQLTRDPGALSTALEKLVKAGQARGGEGRSALERAAAFLVLQPEGVTGSGLGIMTSFQPPLARRLARLERLGAALSSGTTPAAAGRASGRHPLVVFLLVSIFGLLGLLMLWLMLVAMGLAILLSFAIDMLFAALVIAPFHWLLRSVLAAHLHPPRSSS